MRLNRVEMVRAVHRAEDLPTDGRQQVAFVGRSNVGKSSLLNALVNRRNLARVSQTPGKTRGIYFYLTNDSFHLVDLPGYGFAKVSRSERASWEIFIHAYLAQRDPPPAIVLLVDSRHPPQPLDLGMAEWLETEGLDYCVVLTKSDKLSRSARAESRRRAIHELSLGEAHPVIPVSSETSEGLKELIAWIETIVTPATRQPQRTD